VILCLTPCDLIALPGMAHGAMEESGLCWNRIQDGDIDDNILASYFLLEVVLLPWGLFTLFNVM